MVSEKFYSLVDDRKVGKIRFEERKNGRRVQIVPWLSTFIHDEEDHGDIDGCGGPFDVFEIIEEVSGRCIGRGLTDIEAIKEAQKVLEELGKETFQEKIIEAMIVLPVSPKFRGKMAEMAKSLFPE